MFWLFLASPGSSWLFLGPQKVGKALRIRPDKFSLKSDLRKLSYGQKKLVLYLGGEKNTFPRIPSGLTELGATSLNTVVLVVLVVVFLVLVSVAVYRYFYYYQDHHQDHQNHHQDHHQLGPPLLDDICIIK